MEIEYLHAGGKVERDTFAAEAEREIGILYFDGKFAREEQAEQARYRVFRKAYGKRFGRKHDLKSHRFGIGYVGVVCVVVDIEKITRRRVAGVGRRRRGERADVVYEFRHVAHADIGHSEVGQIYVKIARQQIKSEDIDVAAVVVLMLAIVKTDLDFGRTEQRRDRIRSFGAV